jgi:nitroreductase
MMHADFPYEELIKAQPQVVSGADAEIMLRSRRSCRSYAPELPERGDLECMIRVAMMAPTAFNCEDRAIVVVTDRNVLEALKRGLVKETKRNMTLLSAFAARPLSFLLPAETIEHFQRMLLDFEATLPHVEKGHDMFFHDAPALVLFTSTSSDPFGKDHALLAMSYFMTQAQAMGYGTCINGHLQAAHKLVARHVPIKKYHRVFGAITLGRPNIRFHHTVTRKAADVSWVGEYKA